MGLKNVAKEQTKGLSDLFEGREQLKKKDRKQFLETELTVQDFDVLDYNNSHYAVVVFDEKQEYAYSAGKQLTQMIDAYVEECGGIKEAREQYKDEEPLVIIMHETETKEGNTFVAVEVVDAEHDDQQKGRR